MNNYTCPVCGYDHLIRPPADHLICPCCGTQFGLDDEDLTYAELRLAWVANGARWWSPNTAPPANWDPTRQLFRVEQMLVAPEYL